MKNPFLKKYEYYLPKNQFAHNILDGLNKHLLSKQNGQPGFYNGSSSYLKSTLRHQALYQFSPENYYLYVKALRAFEPCNI